MLLSNMCASMDVGGAALGHLGLMVQDLGFRV